MFYYYAFLATSINNLSVFYSVIFVFVEVVYGILEKVECGKNVATSKTK